jgi:hypothetical protein
VFLLLFSVFEQILAEGLVDLGTCFKPAHYRHVEVENHQVVQHLGVFVQAAVHCLIGFKPVDCCCNFEQVRFLEQCFENEQLHFFVVGNYYFELWCLLFNILNNLFGLVIRSKAFAALIKGSFLHLLSLPYLT